MPKSIAVLALSVIAAFTLPATHVMADVLVPSGLAPGSQYQLIFVTSGTTNAESSDINYYNNFVQNAANAAGIGTSLGITWTAIASTDSVNALTNAPSLGPVYDLAGNLITQSSLYSTFNTPLTNLPVIDEYGANILSVNNNAGIAGGVWTGTTAVGTGATIGYAEADGTLGVPNPYPMYVGYSVFGDLGANNVNQGGPIAWLTSQAYPPLDNPTGFIQAQPTELSLYGLSSVLTVPRGISTPEPTTFTLLASGFLTAGGFGLVRRRRGRASDSSPTW
jgi:hypothetical protein